MEAFISSSDVLFCFIRNFFPFHLFRFLLLCMWQQKESLYKTIRRKAVILMKITSFGQTNGLADVRLFRM